MKPVFLLIILISSNFVGISQSKAEGMEVIERIELKEFSNRLTLEMASEIIDLSKSRNQHIAIEIVRLNHTVFLYIDDSLPMDKHNWLRRKMNVAKRFEESSLSVKNSLQEKNMTLEKTFGLDEKDFLAKGGSIPIFVKGSGMVAIITVSGLHDTEDHNIIIEALRGKYF